MKRAFVWIGMLSLGAALLTARPAAAEDGDNFFGFNINFPTPTGDTTDVLKNGFGFAIDVGHLPEDNLLGFRIDISHASWELTSSVLNNINQADTGYASTWAFNMGIVAQVPGERALRPYIQIAPGLYYQHAEASRFAGGGGVVCDPWYGCWEVSNTQDVADWSTWRFGVMGGAGLNIEFSGGGALFLQAQYHVIDNTHAATEYAPLAIGFRQKF